MGLESGAESSVFDHQTAVLHDLDARAGKALRYFVVPYSGLKPDKLAIIGDSISGGTATVRHAVQV
jgi:hypothetical protein